MADKEDLRSVNLIQVKSNVNVCFDGGCKKKTSQFLTEKFDTEHGHSFLGEYISEETFKHISFYYISLSESRQNQHGEHNQWTRLHKVGGH